MLNITIFTITLNIAIIKKLQRRRAVTVMETYTEAMLFNII